MDREDHELQKLGFFGILKDSFKVIFSWRKIFSKITLSLILPLSIIFLAHIKISQWIFFGTLQYENGLGSPFLAIGGYRDVHNMIPFGLIMYALFKLAYFTFVIILSLLSTSAVVYTIACAYTSKEVTFKKVMKVVPRVWKRLMVTFLWSFAIVFVYNMVALLVFVLLSYLVRQETTRVIFFLIFIILYLIGLLYITIVWYIASVVSAIEEVYGIKALVKSKNLIKGKLGSAIALFILIGLCFVSIQILFEAFVVFGWEESWGMRIGIGVVCLLLLVKVILFELVIQTVLYFVCKSYHKESIDKKVLGDHLESYVGDYVGLKSKAHVQMEGVNV